MLHLVNTQTEVHPLQQFPVVFTYNIATVW